MSVSCDLVDISCVERGMKSFFVLCDFFFI